MSIYKDIYGSNPKPVKPTIKRKFGNPFKKKDLFESQVQDEMERKDTAENTLENERLHQMQSKSKE